MKQKQTTEHKKPLRHQGTLSAALSNQLMIVPRQGTKGNGLSTEININPVTMDQTELITKDAEYSLEPLIQKCYWSECRMTRLIPDLEGLAFLKGVKLLIKAYMDSIYLQKLTPRKYFCLTSNSCSTTHLQDF